MRSHAVQDLGHGNWGRYISVHDMMLTVVRAADDTCAAQRACIGVFALKKPVVEARLAQNVNAGCSLSCKTVVEIVGAHQTHTIVIAVWSRLDLRDAILVAEEIQCIWIFDQTARVHDALCKVFHSH
jgi:hypothetical protein